MTSISTPGSETESETEGLCFKIWSSLCEALDIDKTLCQTNHYDAVKIVAKTLFGIDIDEWPLEYEDPTELEFAVEKLDELEKEIEEMKSPSDTLISIYFDIKRIVMPYTGSI